MVLENRKPGSRGWSIPQAGKVLGSDSTGQVKAFFGASSVDRGGSIDLKISTSSPGPVDYEIYRMGWYQGLGGRLVDKRVVDAVRQPACVTDSRTGMLSCPWATTTTVQVPPEWMSGIYLVVLTRGIYQNWATFVVRDDADTSSLVAMVPTTTFQAYNNHPSGKGKSLYESTSTSTVTGVGTTRAVKVSFDRPYGSSGAYYKLFFSTYAAGYLEGRGFPVTYITSEDLDRDPATLQGHAGLLSLGHDEYWTGSMFTSAAALRDSGVDLAFFGGNGVYWQSRLEPSASGTPRRTLTCYKVANLDPEPTTSKKTIRFREIGRPEQTLMGAMYPLKGGFHGNRDFSWVVNNAAHWIYKGTGLGNLSTMPRLVGGETDRYDSAFPVPAGRRTMLSRSPVTDVNGVNSVAESWIYVAPSGALVFDASTWRINHSIGGIGSYNDPRTPTVSTNLMSRFLGLSRTTTTARDGGAERYSTAVLTSQRAFPNTTGGTVVIATGQNFPDALAAGPATKALGPVLLVSSTEVPPVVATELQRLAPSRIIIAGGPAVVSDAVADQLGALTGATVERRSGANRYSTAASLSQWAFEPGVPVAYVATGTDFPDALSGGAAAAALGGPVLLTSGSTLNPDAAAELQRLAPRRIVIVGTTGAVTAAAEATLRTLAPEVVRLSGSDRFETSRAVSRDLRGPDEAAAVFLAVGTNYPDALTAGPAVAAQGGTLVLTGPTLTPGVAEEVVRNNPPLVVAVGGTSVVTPTFMTAVKKLFDVADGTANPLVAAENKTAAPELSTAPTAPPKGAPDGKPAEIPEAPFTGIRAG